MGRAFLFVAAALLAASANALLVAPAGRPVAAVARSAPSALTMMAAKKPVKKVVKKVVKKPAPKKPVVRARVATFIF